MNKFKRVIDVAGTEFYNGLNAANPEHNRIQSLGLSDEYMVVSPAEELSDNQVLTRMSLGVSALSGCVSAGLWILNGSNEFTKNGVAVTAGGIAMAGFFTILDKFTKA